MNQILEQKARTGLQFSLIFMETSPVAMGWHGVANATPVQMDITFLPPLEICQKLCYYCLIIYQGKIYLDFN